MGGDGGVIASQRKFIRGTKNSDDDKDGKNIKQQQITRTRICAQSSEVKILFPNLTLFFRDFKNQLCAAN